MRSVLVGHVLLPSKKAWHRIGVYDFSFADRANLQHEKSGTASIVM